MEEIQDGEEELGKRAVIFSRLKRKFLKHIWLARVSILLFVISGLYLIFLLGGLLVSKTPTLKYSQFLSDFIFAPKSKIESMNGRVNLLILGKAGSGHAGGDLTDTMIFASISITNPKITLVSIPRDIWIAPIRAKINSAYYWGNQKESGKGLAFAKSTVEEVIGQPISYALVLDFNGFTKIIDEIGGIDVNIERSFIDEKYPIAGREDDLCGGDPTFACRYETIKFETGPSHMDGETALKFVRSRNAQGDEGTDLARGKRQDLVLAAIRQKILSPKVFLSPGRIFAIWRVARGSIETDIQPSAGAVLARMVFSARSHIESHVLPEDFLIHPVQGQRYDYQYVFTPKAGDWSQVHEWIKNLL